MGLKGIEPADNGAWSHPPKKKWIHCYMSVGEEKKGSNNNESSELKSGLVVCGDSAPFASPRPSVTTAAVCPLADRRGCASIDDRHSHRRRGAHHHHHPFHPSPSTNGRASPHLTPSFSLSPPVLSSSNPPSSLEAPAGLLNVVKSAPDAGDSHSRSFPAESSLGHLPLEPPAGGRVQSNGFLRPNGLAKPLSPLSREYDDHYSKDEAKKRSGSTPSREVHNKLEKNRRAHLKECFETLRKQLPCMEDKKISNQTILKAAHRYIQNLKRKEIEDEHELERLAGQKISHQQQLSALKKELQAKWDHIDFNAILPDMASLEQNREKETKSTTTASEQPDLEEDSHDSSGHSNSLALTSSPETKITFPSRPMDLTPSSGPAEANTLFTSPIAINTPSAKEREAYLDPNQPLNLSTNMLDVQRSPMRHPSPVRSPHHHQQPPPPSRINGEWPLRRNSHFVASPYANEEKTGVCKSLIGRIHNSATGSVQMTKISPSTSSSLGVSVGRNQASPLSTNASHIPPVSVKASGAVSHISATSNSSSAHISHFVNSGTATGAVPSTTKVVTTFPNLASLPQSGTSITHVPHNTVGSSVNQIHTISSSQAAPSQQPHGIQSESNVQAVPTSVAIGGNLTHVPHLSAVGTTVARVSTPKVPDTSSAAAGVTSHEHSLPIVGGNGIQLPAQLVASGVHLSGPPGTILGQPAIQVITPEGYKLLPAEHTQNGAKPLAITLTHPELISSEGLEHLTASEDGKTGPVMVAVSKNGFSALHLTMPASTRALSNPIGNSVPVTSVPLNLSLGGSGTAVKVTQTGSTPLLSPYLPLTHANGITQLVQGMSLVGPLVVSQSQRGIMVSATTSGAKGVKAQGVSASGGASVPLVPAQYASTIAGGLVNSVVVVSTPTVVGQSGPTSTASVVTSSVGVQSAKQ